jgi:cytochrome c peroxidase
VQVAEEYKELFIEKYGKNSFDKNQYKFKSLYKAMINYEV